MSGLTLAGCGLFPNAFKPATDSSVHDAIQKKDWTYVEKICRGEKRIAFGLKRPQTLACEGLKDRDSSGELANATCEDLASKFEETRDRGMTFVTKEGERFIKCELWTEFFELVLKRAYQHDAAKALKTLADKGHPIHEKFLEYARSQTAPTTSTLPP